MRNILCICITAWLLALTISANGQNFQQDMSLWSVRFNSTIIAWRNQDIDLNSMGGTWLSVTDGSGHTLSEGTHFTVAFTNNKEPGNPTITLTAVDGYGFNNSKENGNVAVIIITGTGATYGSNTISGFVITKRNINNGVDVDIPSSVDYTGSNTVNIPVTLTYAKGQSNAYNLTEGTDYTITTSNISNGYVTVTITPTGSRFDGKPITKQVEVNPININSNVVTKALESGAFTYTGCNFEPAAILTYNGVTLDKGTDYTISYSSNVNDGTGNATISGKGNYTGSTTISFTINKRPISEATLTAASKEYTGSALSTTVSGTLTNGSCNHNMVTNTDFTITYPSDRTSKGTKVLTITGNGNFTGTTTISWEITAACISNATVTFSSPADYYTYDGSPKEPTMTVKLGNKTLVKGTDYTVAYTNNTNAGTATLTITGINNYDNPSCSKIETFTINKRNVTIAPQAVEKKHGESDPSLSYDITSGTLINNNDIGPITVTRASGEDVGIYALTVNYSDNPNYEVTIDNSNKFIIKDKDPVAYATLTNEIDGTTLTFYYNTDRIIHMSKGTTIYLVDDQRLWCTEDNKEKVTQVKFAKSFADYHPTSCADWFYGFENVTYFNVDYLNTSDVTDMSNMFRNCKSATYFSGAYNLEISKVENMSGMFQNCSSVYVIHLGRSERNAITNTSKMFDGCKNLTTIISSLDFSSIENLIDDDMFAGCISLIGENETSFKSDNPSGKTYAHLDQGSKNPGYFTAFDGVNHQDFHIFYELNDDKESPAKLDELAPKAFGYGMGQDDFPIYLIEPTREGYIFKGWSLTIGDNTMENVTQISQDSSVIIGNRLFVAQWQQKLIIEDGSIHQESFEDYCAKPFGNVELSFKVVQGKPTHYSITVPNQSSLSQSGKVIDEGHKTYKIEIDVPSQTEPGIYDGTITFYDNEQLSVPLTQPLGFKLTVYIPKDVIKQLYYNVIFVDNHDSIYIGYQWRKNGDKTTNEYANRQYYYEKELSGQYTVDLTTKSGAILTSCPVGDDNLAKQLSPTVTPYPNPAKAGVPFTLKLIGGVPENASIMIFNNAGAQVMRIDNVNEYTTITLPRGFYSGALIYDGQKSGFKIIVE